MYHSGFPTKITTDDSVLPTGSGDTVLFTTSTLCTGKRQLQSGGISKFAYNIKHDENGSIRVESSKDRGVTWVAEETIVLAAGASSSKGDVLIETFDDWRIIWVNGGTDQTVWVTNLALADDRSAAA